MFYTCFKLLGAWVFRRSISCCCFYTYIDIGMERLLLFPDRDINVDIERLQLLPGRDTHVGMVQGRDIDMKRSLLFPCRYIV